MKKLTINRWAAEDRPREKMMLKGAEALSDAELLAILIGSGNTEESAVALCMSILLAHKGMLSAVNHIDGGAEFRFWLPMGAGQTEERES